MRWGFLLGALAGCGGASGPAPKSEVRDEERIREILKGWDVHLCSLSPRDLLLAERWCDLQSTTSRKEEVESRAERKLQAALSFVKNRGMTLGSYLAAVGTAEAAFLGILQREADVEATAAARLGKKGGAPPTDAEIYLYLLQETRWISTKENGR